MSNLFLFGRTIFSLLPEYDPRHQPGFPLSAEQYKALKPDEVWSLFEESVRADPGLAASGGTLPMRLAYLINDKLHVNAVRIHGGAGGKVECRAARIDDEVLTMLSVKAADGQLDDVTVETVVWKAETA